MKKMRLMNILTAALLSVMLPALPVFAQNEEQKAEALVVPTAGGETDISAENVYVTDPGKPGVLVIADKNDVKVSISGDIDAVYGGVDMSVGDGHVAELEAGGIRGGFGVLTYIDGGQITGRADSVSASGDTALEAVLSRSGSLQFTANTISSDVNAVTLETGADFSDHIVDSEIIETPEEPGEDDWDVIEDEEFGEAENSAENVSFGKYLPENPSLNESGKAARYPYSEPLTAKTQTGSGDVVISSGSIDAGGTAVDILLKGARTVSLTADEITSEASAVLIELSEEGGDVALSAPSINAGGQGIMIQAPAGKVTVNNEDYLSGKSAAEVFNDGAEVTLNSGFIYSNSGLFVESTSGTTIENTEDIAADNYGIYVRTHEAVEEQPFDPGADSAEQGIIESAEGNPSVEIIVDGDIADDFKFPEEPGGNDSLPSGESESIGIAKDGEEVQEEENNETSTGIIVEAETAGMIDISVLGEVYMAYGNEIDADSGAEVSVSVRDDVTTTYGNRISSDNAKVTFSVGESINAGGKALDTLASNDGKLEITVGKDINVSSSGSEEETAGIYANSMENGTTKIEVGGGVSVLNENGETPAYGVFAENTGGEITVTVNDDVTADGAGSVGAAVINGSDSAFSEIGNDDAGPDVKTVLEIMGNLTGKATGLYIDGTGSTLSEVFVEDTISGDDAGVEISDEVVPENLDLKVWKIVLRSGKAVTGGTNAEGVEDHVNYLIKYASDDLQSRLEAADENGVSLPSVHGYQYAKDGAKVYFRVIDGSIPRINNGDNALTKEADGRFSLIVPTGGGILISASSAPRPVDPPREQYPLTELFPLLDLELPETGFAAGRVTPLSARPQGLSYRKTGLTLQIPGLDVEAEIVKVPETDGSYRIEWLDNSIGLLEHSSLPGKGITVLTGHNHLNSAEAGPFLFIGTMETGDRIMITDAGNNARIYKVYGNYKVASNGFASVADKVRENALVLITCEDEAVEGGYINRRIILAEPLG